MRRLLIAAAVAIALTLSAVACGSAWSGNGGVGTCARSLNNTINGYHLKMHHRHCWPHLGGGGGTPAPAPAGCPAGCDSQSYTTAEGCNCHNSSGWHFVHV